MVDTTEALESAYLTANIVGKSKSKTIVVVDPGNYENTEYGKRLTVKVNIDGKIKQWRPNKEAIREMNKRYGSDTVNWVGKPTILTVKLMSNEKLGVVLEEIDKNAAPNVEELLIKPKTEASV